MSSPGHSSPSSTSNAPLPAVNGRETPVNILIVDDEVRNLDVLESILYAPGYRLVRAASANAALLALVEGDFAVLVLDINMPVTNGIELANLIKQRKRTAQRKTSRLTVSPSQISRKHLTMDQLPGDEVQCARAGQQPPSSSRP